MKRSITAFAIILGYASAAWAAPPAPLTTLRAIHALSNAEAAKQLPVAFEATVTYYRHSYDVKNLFVQDDGEAIYVLSDTDFKLAPGDRVLVRGTTSPSFRPIVKSEEITVLGHGALPKPTPASFDELIRVQDDCMLVAVRGVVRTADLLLIGPTRDQADLRILTDDGPVEAVVDGYSPDAVKDLLDAEVEIVGAAGGRFDGKMQQTGIQLHVSSFADIKILKLASANPWSLPVTPMDEILTNYHVNDLTGRIRVQGTITYYQAGSAIVLQNGAKSLWVETLTSDDLRIGDVADATGFPDTRNGFLVLTGGEIQDSHLSAPIAPQPATTSQLSLSHNLFDLVSIEGQVVAEVRETAQDEYVLVSGGHLFSATIRHPATNVAGQLPPLKQIAPGSKVQVTGICILDESNPFSGPVSFNILLRSFDDIAVVGNPSLLNVRNLMILVGLLLTMVVVVGARGWALERNVRRQTAATADLERRRARILEDINGSRPLAEIVEQIAELVSFKLKSAPCWCQIAEGARLGNCPRELSALRIVREEIPARSGPPLGVIFAGFDPLSQPLAADSEALSMGVGLAALAIETRRLYSDLLRRSEFDLLTDIHNRFSLEQHLDALIEEARLKAGIFGLIYIDLDKFKQVNDLYGHRFGDLYLQEVSLRMKRQLRSHDTLARLGGDEFAALLPVIRSLADVEEIAQRLERSFDEPFAIEGQVLHGSASVGFALYPEDGATKDSLLNVADTAMYEAKNTKKQIEQMLDGPSNPDPAPKDRL